MLPNLLRAIQSNSYWMENFTRQYYQSAFKKYCTEFFPSYEAAIRAAEDEVGMVDLVNQLLDALSAGWRSKRLWQRTRAKLDDQQMIVSYLTPMLLSLPDPRGMKFAELLQMEWEKRWPKEAYRIGDYDRIRGGFRDDILGIPLKPVKEKNEHF